MAEIDRRRKGSHVLELRRNRALHDLSQALTYREDGHLVTFAPTGSGKGVGVIIPNLLHYDGPAIVIDPKGENFAVTARHRQKAFRQQILLLDPFEAVDDELLQELNVRRGCLNPFDLRLLPFASPQVDAQMLAGLILRNDPSLVATKVVSGVIAHLMERADVLDVDPTVRLLTSVFFDDDPVETLSNILDRESPSRFVVQAIGSGFLSSKARESRESVLASIQGQFAAAISEEVQSSVGPSTMDLRLVQGDSHYTIYIVIPPSKLSSHGLLLRLWVSALLHTMMERKRFPVRRTLFLLDECANLGYLAMLSKAITLLRGYGLQVWMLFQDLSQMQEIYNKEYRTMLNNCGVLQAFGVRRMSAAKALSELIGGYKPEEILALDQSQQLLSISSANIRVARLMRYFRDGAFEGLFDSNPLHTQGI